jgi:phage terminase large subunit
LNKIVPYPKISPVFEWNYTATADIVINQGGTSSGKTVAILQVLFLRAATEAQTITTVVASDIPDLKSGALRDAKFYVVAPSDYIQGQIEKYNEHERVYYFKNGSIIEFKSFETEFDARSGKRHYLYINEGQNVKFEVYEQLAMRTFKQVFIDYNPTRRFWAHDLIGLPNAIRFISNFTHNPYCDDKVIRQLLRWRTANAARWRVYGLGMTGEIEGAIFTNVHEIDKLPDLGYFVFGLDFGYRNDPTALVKMGKGGNALYGQELIYEKGLSNALLVKRLKDVGVTKNDQIIADPADPKAIDYLTDEGFWCEPAEKGPDSIRFGIERIQSFEAGMFIAIDSLNWWAERENYVWQKKDGKDINKPIDAYNHCWDAARYATYKLDQGGGMVAFG